MTIEIFNNFTKFKKRFEQTFDDIDVTKITKR